jgi:hypothetical protein
VAQVLLHLIHVPAGLTQEGGARVPEVVHAEFERHWHRLAYGLGVCRANGWTEMPPIEVAVSNGLSLPVTNTRLAFDGKFSIRWRSIVARN